MYHHLRDTVSNQHSTQADSTQTNSDDELCENLRDLIVEKQETEQRIENLDNQIKMLQNDSEG